VAGLSTLASDPILEGQMRLETDMKLSTGFDSRLRLKIGLEYGFNLAEWPRKLSSARAFESAALSGDNFLRRDDKNRHKRKN
jgi:hypothetical protein